MSRAIDADALEKEGWSLHRTIQVDKYTSEYQTKPLRQVPTIEPRCETCETFNKTRLLIPQPQRTGRWELIDDTEFRVPGYRCSVCHCECEDWDKKPTYRFCPNCGARMEGEE